MLWQERAKGTTKRVVRVRAQQREGRIFVFKVAHYKAVTNNRLRMLS